MGMAYDSHGTPKMLYTGCAECHDVTTTNSARKLLFDIKIEEFEAVIEGKLEELGTQLTDAGVYNPGSGLANTGIFKANAVIAYINYNMIEEDRSLGIHNPTYTKAILDNSITAMTTLGYPPPTK